MEFRDNVVILEPERAGVQTNLLVWTASQQLVYEVQPASETSEWPFVIRESFAPSPLPPPVPEHWPRPWLSGIPRTVRFCFLCAILRYAATQRREKGCICGRSR